VAAALKKELGVDAEIVGGDRGEFTVWVDDAVVARKGWIRFPSNQKVVDAVRGVLK